MLCQECQQRQATLHFTKIINGEKMEMHICEQCAKEKGESLPGLHNSFSIHNLLSGLLNFDTSANGALNQTYTQPLRCNRCGLTYAQFSRSGRFGCAECYQAFGDKLDPLFRKVHSGNVIHYGKIPQRSGGLVQMKRELQELKHQLHQAISNEEFEHAAQLRDRIRDLEHHLEQA